MWEIAASFKEIGTNMVSMELSSLVQQAKVEFLAVDDIQLLDGGESRLILDASGGLTDAALRVWTLKQGRERENEYYCGTLHADGQTLLYQGTPGISTVKWSNVNAGEGSLVLLEEFAALVKRINLPQFLLGICAEIPMGYEVRVCPDLSALFFDIAMQFSHSKGLLF